MLNRLVLQSAQNRDEQITVITGTMYIIIEVDNTVFEYVTSLTIACVDSL